MNVCMCMVEHTSTQELQTFIHVHPHIAGNKACHVNIHTHMDTRLKYTHGYTPEIHTRVHARNTHTGTSPKYTHTWIHTLAGNEVCNINKDTCACTLFYSTDKNTHENSQTQCTHIYRHTYIQTQCTHIYRHTYIQTQCTHIFRLQTKTHIKIVRHNAHVAGNGVCNVKTGTCACKLFYFGADCSKAVVQLKHGRSKQVVLSPGMHRCLHTYILQIVWDKTMRVRCAMSQCAQV